MKNFILELTERILIPAFCAILMLVVFYFVIDKLMGKS